eukprot:762663-Hanusia_phi.AAC.2
MQMTGTECKRRGPGCARVGGERTVVSEGSLENTMAGRLWLVAGKRRRRRSSSSGRARWRRASQHKHQEQ